MPDQLLSAARAAFRDYCLIADDLEITRALTGLHETALDARTERDRLRPIPYHFDVPSRETHP